MSKTDILIARLQKMKDYLEQTKDRRCESALDDTLQDLFSCDAFGTEGQNDPRGDQRDAEFSEYDKMSPEEQAEWDGEFEYFDVGDVYSAPEVVQNLINLVKTENDEEYSQSIEEAFDNIFVRFGF